jgi:hypothetical protein
MHLGNNRRDEIIFRTLGFEDERSPRTKKGKHVLRITLRKKAINSKIPIFKELTQLKSTEKSDCNGSTGS